MTTPISENPEITIVRKWDDTMDVCYRGKAMYTGVASYAEAMDKAQRVDILIRMAEVRKALAQVKMTEKLDPNPGHEENNG